MNNQVPLGPSYAATVVGVELAAPAQNRGRLRHFAKQNLYKYDYRVMHIYEGEEGEWE